MNFPRASSAAGLLTVALLLSACGEPVLDTDQIPLPEEVLEPVALPDVVSSDCPPVNADPATTSVPYINAEMGIRFTVPYNEKWGSAAEHFPAYVEQPADDVFPYGYVLFGPPTPNFGPDPSFCMPSRSYELTFLPARTVAATERAIRDGRTEVVPNTTVRSINGLTVVQYTDVGLCNFPTMEVIGTRFNYSFTTGCGTDEEEEWQYLEDIMKSVELTQ